MINLQKQKIQEEAYNAWLANNKIASLEIATGVGKTMIAFRAILSMPKGSNVLFLAETVVREKTVLDDSKQYLKFYGIDPLKDYKFRFAVYQGAYKYTIKDYFPNCTPENTIIIFDEIHDVLSTERYKFIINSGLENSLIPRLGLSATIDRKTLYNIGTLEITKYDLLKKFAPVCFTYSLQESIDNKTTRGLKFFVLKHNLDHSLKRISTGKAGAKFLVSELQQYGYLNKAVRTAQFSETLKGQAKIDRVIQLSSNRARFLYTLPSKVISCQSLLASLPGKTLVFGKESNTLLSICSNAIVAKNPNRIKDLDDFKKDITQQTASEIILKQGENIPNLDNIILLAYYSKVKDFTQFIGRCRQDKLTGNVIVYVTTDTQEEVWFRKMTEELDEPFIYCNNIPQLLKQI